MTLTIEIDALTESRLRADSQEERVSLEEMAARWMAAAAMTDEEWEEAEDEADNAVADERMAASDPAKWIALDEVRPASHPQRRAA